MPQLDTDVKRLGGWVLRINVSLTLSVAVCEYGMDALPLFYV